MSIYRRTNLTRRRFLQSTTCGLAMGRTAIAATATQSEDEPFFVTRGVVITAEDLTLADWPERAKAAGLTTLGPDQAYPDAFF